MAMIMDRITQEKRSCIQADKPRPLSFVPHLFRMEFQIRSTTIIIMIPTNALATSINVWCPDFGSFISILVILLKTENEDLKIFSYLKNDRT
tara:strand:+ start:3000 stop:3275 length:276 start_codon:yes stop_codon:yes gene_type:complete